MAYIDLITPSKSKLTGSLTQTAEGLSAFVAGSNVTITSGTSTDQIIISSTGGGGGGAPTTSAYVTIGNDTTLTAERALTAGSGVTITDGGANSTVTIINTAQGDTGAAYVTIGNTGSLSNERSLTAGTGLSLTDGGANSTVTLGINNAVVATVSGTTFSGGVKFSSGLTGSLLLLPNGQSFIAQGTGISVVSSSAGQVVISATGNNGNQSSGAAAATTLILSENKLISASNYTNTIPDLVFAHSSGSFKFNYDLICTNNVNDYCWLGWFPSSSCNVSSFKYSVSHMGSNTQYESSTGSLNMNYVSTTFGVPANQIFKANIVGSFNATTPGILTLFASASRPEFRVESNSTAQLTPISASAGVIAGVGSLTRVYQPYSTAGTYSYTIPSGMQLTGVWIRPGAAGGTGGAGGGNGASANVGGGGGGGSGTAGPSCQITFLPIVASASHVLSIVVGAGGAGGTGGTATNAGMTGSVGFPSSVTNTTTSTLLVRANTDCQGLFATNIPNAGLAGGASGGGAGTSAATGGHRWPTAANITTADTSIIIPTAGAGGGSSAAGGNGSISVSTVTGSIAFAPFGTTYTNIGASGSGGAASGTQGGGGAGSCGKWSWPGDEFVSVLGIPVPPLTGPGSGAGGTAGNGGAGNNSGTGGNGTNGGDGQSGSGGRGGGSGGGGGGGGSGSVTGGTGGSGGNGGVGSAGAVVLVLDPA